MIEEREPLLTTSSFDINDRGIDIITHFTDGNLVKPRKSYTYKLILTSCIISLNSFLYGFDTSCLNSLLVSNTTSEFSSSLDLPTYSSSYLLASLLFGAVIGSFFSHIPIEYTGHHRSLLGVDILLIIGACLAGGAIDVYMLIVGRFIQGIAIGVTSVLCPLLLSEIAPRNIRGEIISIHQFMITVGILVAQAFGLIVFQYDKTNQIGWRVFLGVGGALPAIIQLIFLLKNYVESPMWLWLKKRQQEALVVLSKLRGAEGKRLNESLTREFSAATLIMQHDTTESGIEVDQQTLSEFHKAEREENIIQSHILPSPLYRSLSSPSVFDSVRRELEREQGQELQQQVEREREQEQEQEDTLGYPDRLLNVNGGATTAPLPPYSALSLASAEKSDDFARAREGVAGASSSVPAPSTRRLSSRNAFAGDPISPHPQTRSRSELARAFGRYWSLWKELLKHARPLFIGICSMSLMEATGINVVIYSSTSILAMINDEPNQAAQWSVLFSIVNVTGTVLAIYLIDRLGRKPLLYLGLVIMVIASFGLFSLSFFFSEDGHKNLPYVVGLSLSFVLGFSFGLGTALWPVLCEVFPAPLRPRGMALSLTFNWFLNLIMIVPTTLMSSPTILQWFALFGGVSLMGLIFVRYVPETSKKDSDQIQVLLYPQLALSVDYHKNRPSDPSSPLG
eukprot:TRINITY_DN339_c0_g2_i1.p1 TRINITY_DN339_c0_g2~~TRINITY_DN339_c0_g2_i1.p1  ORF type:complete len:680 (+),score=121.05 TRINITY_DN339_c0_g2_i1:58-2097(+)